MPVVRSQLRSARQAYWSTRYPGDLVDELLPAPALRTAPSRRWLLLGGAGASAAAAVVILSLLMSRVSGLPRPWQGDPSQRALVDWLPTAPESFPLPKFQAPALPDMNLQVPGVQRYRGLALPYPNLKLQAPNLEPLFDLPPLPELPGRGVEWLRKAWHSIDAA